MLVKPIKQQLVTIPITDIICKTSSHTPIPLALIAIGLCLVLHILNAPKRMRNKLLMRAINGANGNTGAKNTTNPNWTIIVE